MNWLARDLEMVVAEAPVENRSRIIAGLTRQLLDFGETA
ncbi:metal-responsive CopG/Arc/MetJ family transcriptional regulator [Nocardia sp. GAS34]